MEPGFSCLLLLLQPSARVPQLCWHSRRSQHCRQIQRVVSHIPHPLQLPIFPVCTKLEIPSFPGLGAGPGQSPEALLSRVIPGQFGWGFSRDDGWQDGWWRLLGQLIIPGRNGGGKRTFPPSISLLVLSHPAGLGPWAPFPTHRAGIWGWHWESRWEHPCASQAADALGGEKIPGSQLGEAQAGTR